MAEYDLAWAAGVGLTAGACGNLLDLAASFYESVDVFAEAGTIDGSCFFPGLVCHGDPVFSDVFFREKTTIIHQLSLFVEIAGQ